MLLRLSLRNRTTLAVVALGMSGVALAIAVFLGGESSPIVVPLRDTDAIVRQAIADGERGDVESAKRRLTEVLHAEPNHPDALLYLGQLAAARGDRDAALGFWGRVSDSAGRVAASARYQEALLQIELRQARAAERLLMRAIELDSNALAPLERLVRLYVAQLRSDDICASLDAIERLRPLTPDELVLRIVADDRILNVDEGIEITRAFVKNDPADIESRLALARYLSEGHAAEAKVVLNELLASDREHQQALALLAGLELDDGNIPAASHLLAGHRPGEASPAIFWLVLGRLQEASGDMHAAGRSYVEAARRQLDDGRARYRLAQVLERLGRHDQAAAQLDRAKLLDELKAEALLVSRALRERRPPAMLSLQISNVADRLARLGQKEHAQIWYRHALRVDPSNIAARPTDEAIRNATVVAGNDALSQLRFSHGESLTETEIATEFAKPPNVSPAGDRDTHISLRDQSGEAKCNFFYFNGGTGKKYLVETVGGGVAVLDYDGDGWPDLFFCQGSDLPHDIENREHADRLFRNRGDGTFEDVTDRTGLMEHNYSLGCTAADFDNDGDPDLYIANYGRDTLFLNNGDGTFRDVTESAGISEEWMSASAAFADLDRDGNLDLYIATYVDSLRECHSADGLPSACDPRSHGGVPDVLFRSNGDGTFTDVSGTSGIAAAPDGKGLGVIVADLNEDGRPDVYVSNDTTPNFLFVNRTEPEGPIRFEERGLASGSALSGDGQAQAGMGIAAADFDGNGHVDLHVTNFYHESNTLYRNLGDGQFEDVSRQARLTAATMRWLGFGTQAADFDLDGLPDLFVANGHIDDFESRGVPWKMPAQLFRNAGGGQFVEITESAGSYFTDRWLGRGVARLDWNRDGRPDLAVVHHDRTAALLTNETRNAGRSARIQVYGTRSNRDGIGCRLLVTAGGRTQVIEVCSGDGIASANERMLIVGVGAAERIDRLEVRWPSNETASFVNLPVDRKIVIREGLAATDGRKFLLMP